MQKGQSVPQVSIIVPVYNVEDYLPRCLDSILAQTMPDWECICVDDGSPDGCGAILDDYAAKDARFVVVHKENGGTSTARNAGLDAARASYIGFVDPDDWIEADAYEVALDAARRTGADIVQWRFIAENEDGPAPSKELAEGFFDPLLDQEYFSGIVWDKLFARSLIFENNIRFPPGIRLGQDGSFCVMAHALAKKCFFLGKALCHNDRTRQNSVTHGITNELLLNYSEGIKQACEFVEQGIREEKRREEKRREGKRREGKRREEKRREEKRREEKRREEKRREEKKMFVNSFLTAS